MLKPSKTRVLGGYSKNPTLPLTRTDSFVKVTKGAGSKQSDGNTANTETDSPSDNIITARLRQEGLLPPLPPVDRTRAVGSVTPNKKTPPAPTPAPASSGSITLPSKSKLDRFRQYISDIYDEESTPSTPQRAVPKNGVLTPTPPTPLLGTKQPNPRTSPPIPSKSGEDTFSPAPEIEQISDLIAKLPSDFPIAEWDSMTTQQRLMAARSSGLSPQEQWKLLNASRALSTIAAIQDIQGNSRAYGLTPEKADTISAGLLKIDSARTSVKKGGMPFATDMQRGLFLSQLDKEEQKLLDSVDGQNDGNNGKISRDFRLGNPSQPRKVVVQEVKNGSKLASIAKDVLKAYVGIQYILPASVYMMSMEKISKLIDSGTISIGVSGNAIAMGGVSGNVGLVMDSDGDVGVIYTVGAFGGTPSASALVFASLSNAQNIEDLKEFAFEAGGSFSEGLCLGGEICFFNDQDGNPKAAVNLQAGISAPGLPVEGHAGTTYSWVDPLFNIYDAWSSFIKEFYEW